MFSSLLSAPCELKLHLLQHVVFLRPPTREPSEDAPPSSTDEVARGLVELYVPQDRRIGGIRVKLRAVQSVALLPDQRDVINFAGSTPIAWEDTVLMEKIVDIGMPASKSHATVPGDDSISSADRRGRSRQARDGSSRLVTPVASRPTSPRVSIEGAPPGYEESESAGVAQQSLPPNGSAGGTFGAMVRALSRGRPTSGPSSRPNSQSVSRSASRVGSREHSPSRSPANANGSDPSTPAPIPSPTAGDNLLPTANEADVDTLGGHLSRTGLSRGRDTANGPHAHARDQEDYFGVDTAASDATSPAGPSRGRAAPSSSNATQQRSMTLSPSRGGLFSSGISSSRRDESRVRLMNIARRGPRAPSVDTGAANRSPASSSDEQEGLFLQKGVHGFEFAFIIPSDSAPYERSPYGRVRYVVKATAFGAGRAKSNLETWHDMFPVVNPAIDGGPVPLTVLYNDLHPTVGLLSIACTANNISVGGIFSVDIHSPVPPADLIVFLVRVSVETTTELRTRKKGKQHVPTQRHKLFEKGWVPPRPNDPHGQGDGKRSEGLIRDPTRPGSRSDDAWTVQGIARMPNDNIVRSTTISGTRASIRFSHQLLVEVVHSRADPAVPANERKIKVFALRQPITLPSCFVAYDAVVLPPYTPNDENTRPAAMPYDLTTHGAGIEHASHNAQANSIGAASSAGDPRRRTNARTTNTSSRLYGHAHEFCVCGQSFDDLSERERNLMPARPRSELPLDGLSHRKIGELPDSPSPNGVGSVIGSALRRSTSRSSSTSRDSRDRSLSRRSLSIHRSLGRVRSPSTGSSSTTRRGRTPSVTRIVGRGGAGSLSAGRDNVDQAPGIYANGAGERGEGVIRTTPRGSRPGEDGAFINGAPPTYVGVMEEDSGEEDDEATTSTDNRQRRSASARRSSAAQSSRTVPGIDTSDHEVSSLSSGTAADDERVGGAVTLTSGEEH